MAIAVLILGESGTGKSASMRNFNADEIGVINVENKPLPFQSDIKTFNSDNYGKIKSVLMTAQAPSIVIDDSQYLMANEFMRKAQEVGFQKFTDIGRNFWDLVNTVIYEVPNNKIVYFMHHIEKSESGNIKAKTVGRMLDEKITFEGMFSIVLRTHVVDGQYRFLTKNNGQDTVKTPIGMFEEEAIDNDLKVVDERIREFYKLDEKEEEDAQSDTNRN